ncbi:MAG: hypothetical protein KDB33_21430 [Acidimicrobiales bacterium]|nr:hypothetical protein [Acidimicrobiales bacterium]
MTTSSSRRRTLARRGGAIGVVALALAGCAASGDTTGAASDATATGADGAETSAPAADPVRGGRLNVCVESDPSGYHPYLDRWSASGLTVAGAVYDPLATYDADFGVQPYLAEAFIPNDDATRWTITLRQGVTFHDGTPFDAEALVRHLDNLRESFLTNSLTRPITGYRALDARTVEVDVSQPWATFPVIFTTQAGFVPSPNVDGESLSDQPVGTGPFTMRFHTDDGVSAVARSDSYWRSGLPYLDSIDFIAATATDECQSKLAVGEADVAHLSAETQLAALDTDEGRLQVVRDRGEQEELFVMFQTAAPPFDDPRLREALALATDAGAFAEATGAAQDAVATGPFAPGSPYARSGEARGPDPDRARELVAEIEAERGPVTVTLTATDDIANLQRSQVLEEQWSAVGVDVVLESVDQNTLIVDGIAGSYEAIIWRQFGAPDPDGDYQWWVSPQPGETSLNFSRNVDPEVDRALDDGRATTDPAQRAEAYRRLQERFDAANPYVWLLHTGWVIVAEPWVHDPVNVTLPDGAAAAPVVNGVVRFTETWMDADATEQARAARGG